MKDLFNKLSGAKPDDEQDAHAEAKMQVLQELRDMALGMMGDKVKGKLPGAEMHGVEVMAPDQEGLHKGLELASHALPDDEQGEDPHEEASESPAEEASESDDDDMSPEEIDSMIEELQEKKRQASMKA